MRLTVSQALSLIVTMAQEWLFTLRTNKVLHMPLLSHSIHHPTFNWSPAGSTDWNTHLVMAGQAVEFSFQFPSIGCELLAAVGTVEVIRMVRIILEY